MKPKDVEPNDVEPDDVEPNDVEPNIRAWLFGLEAVGIKLGLEQMRALLVRLEHPESSFMAIAVAGTNGKGSVAAMIERGLRAAGQRTGRYTSPHLIDVEERIVIDGRPITSEAFDRATIRVRTAAQALPHPPSFFEAVTAIACLAFQEAGVTIGVMEVGLGGRLDATNALDAPVAVITHIGLDHQVYLGDTLDAIATEKAGVIKPGATVIVGPTPPVAHEVIMRIASQVGATTVAVPATTAGADVHARYTNFEMVAPIGGAHEPTWRLALPGRHQVQNAITATWTLAEIGRRGLASIDTAAMRLALEDVRWPGRLDWRRYRDRDILVDGAHNPDGARALADYLRDTHLHPVPLVFGMMRDKAIGEVVGVLAPLVSTFVLTAPHSSRALPAAELSRIVASAAPGIPRVVAASPQDGLDQAIGLGTPVVVAGSLFLAGETLSLCA